MPTYLPLLAFWLSLRNLTAELGRKDRVYERCFCATPSLSTPPYRPVVSNNKLKCNLSEKYSLEKNTENKLTS